MIRRMCLIAVLLAAVTVVGCSSKYVPDVETALNPPVAYQQQFIAEALDNVFRGMDFSRLRGKLVEIEVVGVYPDTVLNDYLRAMLQLELAKAGALSETALVGDRMPDYKANIMLKVGGVNDIVRWALLYEWRQKHYVYDVQVAVFNVKGEDYFVQSGKGATEITVARNFYLLFFPIPLPTEYSRQKGMSVFGQYVRTYDEARRGARDSSLRRDRGNVPRFVR
jgi:hypothetical protein